MILYSQWLKLPLNIRTKMANEFGILKKGSTHVVDNHVQSDGYLVQDIEGALSLSTLQLYLGEMKQTDMQTLWKLLVERMLSEAQPPKPVAPKPVDVQIMPKAEVLKAKRAYNKRNAIKNTK